MSSFSHVWEFFNKNKISSESECRLCIINPCKNCSKERPCHLKGVLASNAKKHLKFIHPDEYTIVEEKDSEKDLHLAKKPRLDATKERPNPADFFKPWIQQLSSEQLF